ncbi:MAG TPA: acyl-CoA thioesterase [Thermoanaerobaculia bacterium]
MTNIGETFPSQPYEEIVRVAADDLDERRHVNNLVYVRWVQQIAVAHWHALAPQEDRASFAWVVLRQEIDYVHPAFLDDEIVLRTWVGTASGLSFERHTEIRRRGDDRILARARTLWCPVDAQTGRPRRVRPEVRRLFSKSSAESPERVDRGQ